MQLSDENKILMDEFMLERYRKYKCCVYIAYEYVKLSQNFKLVLS